MVNGEFNTVYKIGRELHNENDLKKILSKNTEIQFVSIMSVDLNGNVTDERIPIKIFLDDLKEYIEGKAIQTDGSSVNLPIISELNDAKVDLVLDLDCNWYVDYSEELFENETGKAIGTLIIPAFIKHNKDFVDSRSILKNSTDFFKNQMLRILEQKSKALYDIEYEYIKNVNFTAATELEFWVKTPNAVPKIDELAASETMHEQYWNRIEGSVRTALEHALLKMKEYGLDPEMGHKEVGGVRPSISRSGKYNEIMEQIEVDWKYTNPIDAADSQVIVKNLIKKIFNSYGLDVSFLAKPIEKVAGNGMHLHIGMNMELNNGERINLFHSKNGTYLSNIGYGALMGILKNYEIVNPFISSTEDAFRRLKPGFEAPVAVVTSLGKSIENPTRNRTVLVGLVMENDSPLATRFELRSPNPTSNLYLTIAATYLVMLDGIRYSANENYTEQQLLDEISKEYGSEANYLEKDRAYRSEENIFSYYSNEELEKYFGKAPRNVYENISKLDDSNEKLKILTEGNVFTKEIINSYKASVITSWKALILSRTMKKYISELKYIEKIDSDNEYDEISWNNILELKREIYQTNADRKSLIERTEDLLKDNNLGEASNLLIELDNKLQNLKTMYKKYKKNII